MLILASNSPRRKELLAQIGVACEVIPGTYAEDVPGRDNPEKFVDIQAAGKAASVALRYPDHWVLGADTVVAADGKILVKPRHDDRHLSDSRRRGNKCLCSVGRAYG